MARRVGKNIVQREDFIILTNGKQTEKNYFELLKSKRGVYEVKIEHKNCAPLALVDFAVKHYNNANQVWCVFDVDSFAKEGKVEPCFAKIKNTNVKIALSNIAFEVWLLSHFKKCQKESSVKELEKDLSKELTNKAKKNLEYSKADKDLLKNYFLPNTQDAINNAQIVHETYRKEYKEVHGDTIPENIICKWNPCTTVYKLVQALNLR